MCTPGSDSYCKLCTNAPTGMTYVTPGNNNDCEYATQDATQVNDFPDADPASLVVFMELPVDETTFNQKGEGFRTAIADVVSGTVDSVKVVSIEEFNMADVDVRDKSTTSSSSSSTSSPADSSTSADSSTAAASSSTGGCGVCGDCVPGDREGEHYQKSACGGEGLGVWRRGAEAAVRQTGRSQPTCVINQSEGHKKGG